MEIRNVRVRELPPFGISDVTPLEWSQRLADSEMARLGDKLDWKAGGKAKWDYTVGLCSHCRCWT